VIQLKSQREIEIMARGGKILAEAVKLLEGSVKAGMSTADLDEIAERFIRSHKGAVPSFKGLYNFPASICSSINNEIVHGIPSRKRVLSEGDVVSLDVGVQYEGYHTDSATTVAVGKVSDESARLLAVTRAARSTRASPPRAREIIWATSGRRCSRSSRPRGSAWCVISSATASAPVFTRSRRCRTTGSRSAESASCRD
jgi:methionine aminopeptidase